MVKTKKESFNPQDQRSNQNRDKEQNKNRDRESSRQEGRRGAEGARGQEYGSKEHVHGPSCGCGQHKSGRFNEENENRDDAFRRKNKGQPSSSEFDEE